MSSTLDVIYKLISAVRFGNVGKVKELIESVGLFSLKGWECYSYILLLNSLECDHSEVAKLLLTYGAQVNRDIVESSATPLHYAIRNKDLEIIEILLNRGANVDAKYEIITTQIKTKNAPYIVEILLKFGSYVNSGCSFGDGYTPLHCAVENGNEEIVRLLVNNKADVDAELENGIAPLHMAAEHGYSHIALYLIEQGAFVSSSCNYLNEGGYTPLHISAKKGFKEITEVLLNEGSAINAVTDNGLTALHVAVKNKHVQLVNTLLSNGADINAKTKDGKTSLLLASSLGYSLVVEELLRHKPDPCERINQLAFYTSVRRSSRTHGKIVDDLMKYGFTVNNEDTNNCELLFSAVVNGHEKVVNDLLSLGANVNSLNENGDTLLHCATKNGNEDVIKLLLKHGCNVNAIDVIGRTPIFYAIHRGKFFIFKLLLKNKANIKCEDNFGITPLHVSVSIVETTGWGDYLESFCMENNFNVNKITNLLLREGSEVDSKTKKGFPPLHVAVQNKFNNFVKLLLDHNANINLKEENGKTPLYLAVEQNNTMTTKLLIEKGANVNARDKIGMTALHVAVESKCDADSGIPVLSLGSTSNILPINKFVRCTYEGVIKMLLINKADVNVKDEYGRTALHIASKGDCKIAVELLLEYNADVNAKDNGNRTPIYYAAQYRKEEIARILLNKGAFINFKDIDGKTALRIAVEYRYAKNDIIKLLLEYGSDPNSRCKLGMTPLHAAGKKNYENIASLLLEYGAGINMLSNNGETTHSFIPGFKFYRGSVDYIIKEHIVKLKLAGLYVIEKNLQLVGSDFEMHNQSEYLKELDRMKNMKIGTSNFSYFDILTNHKNKLAVFCNNDNVLQVLESLDYKAEFPLAAGLLTNSIRNIKMDIERKKLLNGAHQFFCSFKNNFMKLPYDCADEVFSYLSYFDLKIFVSFKSLNLC